MLMMCRSDLCFQSDSGLPSPGWVWEGIWWLCVGKGPSFEMLDRSSLGHVWSGCSFTEVN